MSRTAAIRKPLPRPPIAAPRVGASARRQARQIGMWSDEKPSPDPMRAAERTAEHAYDRLYEARTDRDARDCHDEARDGLFRPVEMAETPGLDRARSGCGRATITSSRSGPPVRTLKGARPPDRAGGARADAGPRGWRPGGGRSTARLLPHTLFRRVLDPPLPVLAEIPLAAATMFGLCPAGFQLGFQIHLHGSPGAPSR